MEVTIISRPALVILSEQRVFFDYLEHIAYTVVFLTNWRAKRNK